MSIVSGKRLIEQDDNHLVDSRLEDFYKQTEGHYPAKNNKYPSFSMNRRVASAPQKQQKDPLFQHSDNTAVVNRYAMIVS